ncbi:MAG: hypothetical protein ACFE96_04845 [Candidatus Hermodarchaeota archaeon]
MEPEKLYVKLKSYLPHQIDLMRHLHVNACWEYVITPHSTQEANISLNFYLYKTSETTLEMSKDKPEIKPDLVLYFTENAILGMIEGIPDAEEYYKRYRNVMENPQVGIEVDNKINKPRLKLWQIGYKQWQKDFKF